MKLIRPLVGALLILSAPAPQRLRAQAPLPALAQELAGKWQAHDFAGLVGEGRVEVRLPGVSASGPVPADQAVVILRGHVRGDVEVEAAVASAMEVTPASGYIQIRRSFRRGGGGGVEQESVLLGMERGRSGGAGVGPWRVTVVQVTGSAGR